MIYTDDMYLEHSKMILDFLRRKYNYVFKQNYFEDLFSHCKMFIFKNYCKNYDNKKSKKSTYVYMLCATAVADYYRKNNKHLKNCDLSLNMTINFDNQNVELQDIIKEDYNYFDQYENSEYIRCLYKKCLNYINNELKSLNNRLASDKFKRDTKIIFKCKIIKDYSFSDIGSKIGLSTTYCQRLYSNLILQIRQYFKKYNYFL